jgi:hypothetical protein
MNMPPMSAETALHRAVSQYRSLHPTLLHRPGITLSGGPWPGTYQATCFGCKLYWGEDWLLQCWCHDDNNVPQFSGVGPDGCSDVANCNGQLTCGGC